MRSLSPIKSGMLILDKQKGRGTHTPQSPLPPDWKSVVFSDLFVPVSRKNTERNNNVLTISAQDGLINQLDYYNHQYASADTSGYTLMKKGEFAYNKSYSGDCPYGAIKRLERYDTGVVSPLYLCFSPKPGVDGDFFVHYFNGGMLNRALYRIAQEGARNHGLLNIPTEGFFDAELIVPPLSEQRRIATVLSTCDRVVEGKQKLLDSKKQQKRALMRMLLETNSGDVPDVRIKRTQWQARKLGKLGYFVSGTGFPLSYQGCSTGDFPFFKVSDMNRIGNETFLEKTDNWISDATRKSLSAIAIPQDAIAFAKVGAACLLERKRRLARASCLDNNMMAFVLESKDIDPAFMHLAFCSIRLSSSANLGTLPSINAGSLKERVVMVPPKSTQERIVAVLSAADREIDGLAREIEAWKQKRKALSQLLLSGKVRV